MTIVDRAAGAALGLAATAAIVWGANAPITVHGSDQAILRLAWSARPERIESCRQLSEEELARLPAHMRQPVVCEGASAQYRLTVRHEGRVVADEIVHGGGLRQDRRLYVFHELPLDPGKGSIEVRFDRIDSDAERVTPPEKRHDEPGETENKHDGQGQGANRQAGGETVPPHMVFAQRLHVQPREVILITYSPEHRALAGIQGSAHAPR
jgi:hypothetical protein